MDQVVSAYSAGGRLGELGRLVGQAWQAQDDLGHLRLDEAGRPSTLSHKGGSVRLCACAPVPRVGEEALCWPMNPSHLRGGAVGEDPLEGKS